MNTLGLISVKVEVQHGLALSGFTAEESLIQKCIRNSEYCANCVQLLSHQKFKTGRHKDLVLVVASAYCGVIKVFINMSAKQCNCVDEDTDLKNLMFLSNALWNS